MLKESDEDVDDDDDDIPDEWADTVDMIKQQTECTETEAWEAFKSSDYQLVDAISVIYARRIRNNGDSNR